MGRKRIDGVPSLALRMVDAGLFEKARPPKAATLHADFASGRYDGPCLIVAREIRPKWVSIFTPTVIVELPDGRQSMVTLNEVTES